MPALKDITGQCFGRLTAATCHSALGATPFDATASGIIPAFKDPDS